MATITLRSGANLQQHITAGNHTFTVDEPVGDGGDDAGPNPYELLLASLAGCTAITLFMYARRKGWPLEEVEITMKNSRVHSDDCAHCEEEGTLVDEIERHIVLRGDLSAEQRERLAYIATRCPVHKTLTTPTHIHDTVA
jgi:putative redox protein